MWELMHVTCRQATPIARSAERGAQGAVVILRSEATKDPLYLE